MRRFGWIRMVGLLCAGVCVTPGVGAQSGQNQQTGNSHRSATAASGYQQPKTQGSAMAGFATKGAPTPQRQATAVGAKASPPTMSTYTPRGSTPAASAAKQTSGLGDNFTAGTTKKPSQSNTAGGSSGGTSDGPATKGSQSPADGNLSYSHGNPATGVNPTTGLTSKPPRGGNSDGGPTNGTRPPGTQQPPTTGTYVPPAQSWPPHHKGPPPLGWPQPTPVVTLPVVPPVQAYVPRTREPHLPITPPPPSGSESTVPQQSPAKPASSPPQSQQPTQPASAAATARSPTTTPPVAPPPVVPAVPPLSAPLPVLTLTSKTTRPVVGKDVVVVPALKPARAGAMYRLNWGDGSVETVSGESSHHYAKAIVYKVSASTVVDKSELNHEVLVDVGPVPGAKLKLLAMLMAALAGVGFWGMHLYVPKLSASFRWGAPSVPEMKLLGREPYASLSFEPGVRPAEGRISFFKKRRKSGSEQE